MHLDKNFLANIENRIGHGCTVTVSAAEIPGLKITVVSRESETGNRHYWSRIFSVDELHNHRVPMVMFDSFATEAKAQLDDIFGA